MDDSQENGNVQAESNSIAIGGISVGGNVGDIRIGHSIGYSPEQVSILLSKIKSEFQPKAFDGRCPYKGLAVFEEEDAELFFGRERLVNDLLNRVKESRTVFITGPSGSGKSSLVRAGLIHSLKQGAIQELHSERWLYETMKPGREPVKDLALAFSRLKSPELADYFQAHAAEADVLHKCAESVLSANRGQRFVLFVDQFEEVFTQVNQEAERLAFLELLAYAGTVENGRVIVVFAMRSDFVSNCAVYPMLNELLSKEFRQIGAMQPEELVAAIALPARHVGLPVEPGLIAQIINDMKGEPGALPLMQFALKDLFDSQQEKGGVIALTLEDYLRHGGIHKSLERHADRTFSELREDEQALARSIFSGLIEIGRGTVDTRRTALFDELIPANTEANEVLTVVQKLADARLVITDEQAGTDTVTISHEKLIDAWPWLRQLVNENRDVIALQNEVATDAKEWEDHGRDPSYLYTGARLANVREQLEARKLVLSGLAQEFIQAGRIAHTDELAAATQRIRRFRILTMGLLLVLIVAGFLGFVAWQQAILANVNAAQADQNAVLAMQNQALAFANQGTAQANEEEAQKQAEEAQRQLEISRSGELTAQSILEREQNLPLSLLLGVEAFKTANTLQTRSSLMNNALVDPRLLGYLSQHANHVTSAVFSPNGEMMASASFDGVVILWNAQTLEPIGKLLIENPVNPVLEFSLAFSPDGTLLAAGGNNKMMLWDVNTRQQVGSSIQTTSLITSIAFSPGGNVLASGHRDTSIVLWDVETRRMIGEPLIGHGDSVAEVAFHPNGAILGSASGDHSIILWNVETGQPIREALTGHDGGVNAIAFSPDGNTVVSGSSDNTALLWSVETGELISQFVSPQASSPVWDVVFSPDGKMVAVASAEILFWDLETRLPVQEALSTHSAEASGLAFSPDGRVLVARTAKDIVLWDLFTEAGGGPEYKFLTRVLFSPEQELTVSAAISPNGQTLAATTMDGATLLLDVKTGQPIGPPLRAGNNEVASVLFSPDGEMLAICTSDGKIRFWDVRTGRQNGRPVDGLAPYCPGQMAFSPDGKMFASIVSDSSVVLWDLATRTRVGEPLEAPDPINSIAIHPDGNLLAAAASNDILLWDLEDHESRGTWEVPEQSASQVAFSPDGKVLATATSYQIFFWDVVTRELIGVIGEPLGDELFGGIPVFSPDGTLLAVKTGFDVSLWDLETQQQLGQPLNIYGVFGIDRAGFSPDGKSLIMANDIGIFNWDLQPAAWIQDSCRRAGRNLFLAEWQRYFPGEPYRETCPEWPKDTAYYKALIRETLAGEPARTQIALEEAEREMTADDGVRDPSAKAVLLTQEVLVEEAERDVYYGTAEKALGFLEQGQPLDIMSNLTSLDLLRNLCWKASIDGYAGTVLKYCDHMVRLAEQTYYGLPELYRDSRGVARAMTGDYEGAIEDFEAFLSWSSIYGQSSEVIAQRQLIIRELKRGNNPFTKELLDSLLFAFDPRG